MQFVQIYFSSTIGNIYNKKSSLMKLCLWLSIVDHMLIPLPFLLPKENINANRWDQIKSTKMENQMKVQNGLRKTEKEKKTSFVTRVRV